MSKSRKIPTQHYLDEIETWRKSSQIHAENAIKQYERVTESLEAIYYEKTRNDVILSSLSDGIIVFDEQEHIIIFNKTAQSILGVSAKYAVGKSIDEVLSGSRPEILAYIQKQNSRKPTHHKRHVFSINKHFISCRLDKIIIRDKIYFLILLEDNTDFVKAQHALTIEKKSLENRVERRTDQLKKEVAEKEKAKQEAVKIALTDTLTGLPNRRAFIQYLEQVVNLSQQQSHQDFVLLFIDLDGFKAINDTLGHHAGDLLLIEVARRMKRLTRTNDISARLGGDEFVIMLNGLNKQQQAINIAQKLLNSIAKPITTQTQAMQVTASIGIYLHDLNDFSPSTILTMADEAMYEAKTRGKNGYVVFDDNLYKKIQNKTSLSQKIDFALANKEFDVYYQAICDIDGNIVGAESLARWTHQGEMISPAKFIPLLEQLGRIKEFTYYIVEQVFMTLLLHEKFPCVSINLSIQQFYDNEFIDYIDDVFSHMPQLKKRISFEITESLFHHDPQSLISGINKLSQRGFRIYIDDFGTGYSSFSYIRNFKADVIKIDREFVIDIENNAKNADLLKGMVALIGTMDLDVIIEGVENQQQIDIIKTFDNEVKIQGYHFYKPVPLKDIIALLEQHEKTTLKAS